MLQDMVLRLNGFLFAQNVSCVLQEYRQPQSIFEKDGKIYEVNCSAVLAFRAIGKGRSAAQKFVS